MVGGKRIKALKGSGRGRTGCPGRGAAHFYYRRGRPRSRRRGNSRPRPLPTRSARRPAGGISAACMHAFFPQNCSHATANEECFGLASPPGARGAERRAPRNATGRARRASDPSRARRSAHAPPAFAFCSIHKREIYSTRCASGHHSTSVPRHRKCASKKMAGSVRRSRWQAAKSAERRWRPVAAGRERRRTGTKKQTNPGERTERTPVERAGEGRRRENDVRRLARVPPPAAPRGDRGWIEARPVGPRARRRRRPQKRVARATHIPPRR